MYSILGSPGDPRGTRAPDLLEGEQEMFINTIGAKLAQLANVKGAILAAAIAAVAIIGMAGGANAQSNEQPTDLALPDMFVEIGDGRYTAEVGTSFCQPQKSYGLTVVFEKKADGTPVAYISEYRQSEWPKTKDQSAKRERLAPNAKVLTGDDLVDHLTGGGKVAKFKGRYYDEKHVLAASGRVMATQDTKSITIVGCHPGS